MTGDPWKLIEDCPWQLNTSEKMALLALGRVHETKHYEWVSALSVALIWKCSEANAKAFLNRSRIAQFIEVKESSGMDGKTRPYYRLRTEPDYEGTIYKGSNNAP